MRTCQTTMSGAGLEKVFLICFAYCIMFEIKTIKIVKNKQPFTKQKTRTKHQSEAALTALASPLLVGSLIWSHPSSTCRHTADIRQKQDQRLGARALTGRERQHLPLHLLWRSKRCMQPHHTLTHKDKWSWVFWLSITFEPVHLRQ